MGINAGIPFVAEGFISTSALQNREYTTDENCISPCLPGDGLESKLIIISFYEPSPNFNEKGLEGIVLDFFFLSFFFVNFNDCDCSILPQR